MGLTVLMKNFASYVRESTISCAEYVQTNAPSREDLCRSAGLSASIGLMTGGPHGILLGGALGCIAITIDRLVTPLIQNKLDHFLMRNVSRIRSSEITNLLLRTGVICVTKGAILGGKALLNPYSLIGSILASALLTQIAEKPVYVV